MYERIKKKRVYFSEWKLAINEIIVLFFAFHSFIRSVASHSVKQCVIVFFFFILVCCSFKNIRIMYNMLVLMCLVVRLTSSSDCEFVLLWFIVDLFCFVCCARMAGCHSLCLSTTTTVSVRIGTTFCFLATENRTQPHKINHFLVECDAEFG